MFAHGADGAVDENSRSDAGTSARNPQPVDGLWKPCCTRRPQALQSAVERSYVRRVAVRGLGCPRSAAPSAASASASSPRRRPPASVLLDRGLTPRRASAELPRVSAAAARPRASAASSGGELLLGRQLAALRHDDERSSAVTSPNSSIGHRVAADPLDRLHRELAPVDADLLLLPELVGDVRRGDRAEQRAGRAGVHVEAKLGRLEAVGDRARLVDRSSPRAAPAARRASRARARARASRARRGRGAAGSCARSRARR